MNEDEFAVFQFVLGVMTVHTMKALHGENWRDALRAVAHGTSPPHLVVDEDMVDMYDRLDTLITKEMSETSPKTDNGGDSDGRD